MKWQKIKKIRKVTNEGIISTTFQPVTKKQSLLFMKKHFSKGLLASIKK